MNEENYKIENGKKVDFIELIRTFKREGIENFIVIRKNKYEDLINKYIEKDKIIDLMINDLREYVYNDQCKEEILEYYKNM